MKKDVLIPKKFLCKLTNDNSWMDKNYNTIIEELGKKAISLVDVWRNRKNDFDFTVYNMQEYSFDTILCWIVYTKKILGEAFRFFRKNNIDVSDLTIFDDFNGAGISSLYMQFEGFKDVYFYNSVNHEINLMYNYCEENNITPPIKVEELGGKYDVVCCFEVMEHEKEPMKRLEKLLDMTNEYFIYSATFGNPTWIGHYSSYIHNGVDVTPRKMSKLLNDRIKEEFELAWSGFNGKPFVYKRKIK